MAERSKSVARLRIGTAEVDAAALGANGFLLGDLQSPILWPFALQYAQLTSGTACRQVSERCPPFPQV